jgi:catabolite regulation protein CreA
MHFAEHKKKSKNPQNLSQPESLFFYKTVISKRVDYDNKTNSYNDHIKKVPNGFKIELSKRY